MGFIIIMAFSYLDHFDSSFRFKLPSESESRVSSHQPTLSRIVCELAERWASQKDGLSDHADLSLSDGNAVGSHEVGSHERQTLDAGHLAAAFCHSTAIDVAASDANGSQVCGSHGALVALLQSLGLGHLVQLLPCETLLSCYVRMEDRTMFLSYLKDRGVALPQRQALANAVAKARRQLTDGGDTILRPVQTERADHPDTSIGRRGRHIP